MKKGILFLISVFTFLFASSPILAAESFTQLGNPNIFAAEQLTLDEPKYLQDTIIMSGQTDLDSIFVKDAIVMSGQTNISPETIITEDLIILSGQQTISGRVKKDVIVIGGEITIDSDAIIDGYLLALGGQVTLAGTVKDSVHIFAGQADIKDTAVIKGDLSINAGEISVADDANIVGEKKITTYQNWRNLPNTDVSKISEPVRTYTRNARQAFSFYSFLTHLIALLILIKFFSKQINHLVKKGLKTPFNTLGQGLLYLLLIPVMGVLLITTLIGIPLASFTFFIYGVSIYLSSIFTAIAIGQYIKGQKLLKTENKYLYGFLGLVIISLLFSFPFLKGLSRVFSLLFGLGIFLTYLKQLFAKKK